VSLDDIDRGLLASLLAIEVFEDDGFGEVPLYCKLDRAFMWVAICDSAFR